MHRIVATLAALVLVTAACGDSGTPPETLPGGVTTVAPAVSEDPPATTDAAAPDGPLVASIATGDNIALDSRTFVGGRDWVVLAHMRPADMTSWFPFAERLAEAGYTAIAFDFRGYGDSDGAPDEFAVDTDVIAVVDFAYARGAERVFVIGASMGGTGALVAAAKRPIAAVATLSAPAEFFGADAVGAAPSISAPKLFVAAADDAPYPAVVADLMAAAPGPKAERIFPGNAHGTDLFADHGDELTALLLDFLDNA